MPLSPGFQMSGHKLPVPPADPPFLYTGVMEIRGSAGSQGNDNAARINLADLDPGMIRIRSEESNPLGSRTGGSPPYLESTLRRSNDILEAGIQMLPCVETDNFSSLQAFKNYLTAYVEAFPEILWWEVGNEPSSWLAGANVSTTALKAAAIRKKFCQYLKAASDILDANGKRLIMSAITGIAGGTQDVLDDIEDDTHSENVDPTMCDALAIHAYVRVPLGTDGYKASLYGYRNMIDVGNGNHPGFAGRPLWCTEIGWPCTYRANGQNPGGSGASQQVGGDWGSGQSQHVGPPGVNSPQPIVIDRAKQAQNLLDSWGDVIPERNSGDLNLRALIWYAHHDYPSVPGNGAWDAHCGLSDCADAHRPVYTTLKNYQRAFAITS